MTETPEPATPRPSRKRIAWIVFLGSLPIVVVVIMILPRLFDVGPYDDRALAPPPAPNISAKENFAEGLLEIDAQRVEPAAALALGDPIDGFERDWLGIESALVSNHDYLRSLDTIFERHRFVVRPPSDIGQPQGEALALRHALHWRSIRCAWLRQRGELDAAVQLASRSHEAAIQFLEYPTSILHMLIGLALRKTTSRDLASLAFHPEVTDEQLERIAAALRVQHRDLFGALIVAVKQEHRALAQTVRNLGAAVKPMQRWFYFRENETLTLLGQSYEKYVDAIETRRGDRLTPLAPLPSPWRTLWGNPTGEAIVGTSEQSFRQTYIRVSRAAMARHLPKVAVALVRYERQHGALPEKLTALVPNFLHESALVGVDYVYQPNERWLQLKGDVPVGKERPKVTPPAIGYPYLQGGN